MAKIKKNKKDDSVSPINISENIWFYPMPKKLEFIVKLKNEYVMFEISRKKLFNLLIKENKNNEKEYN